jgi:hypothetical protein
VPLADKKDWIVHAAGGRYGVKRKTIPNANKTPQSSIVRSVVYI